MENNELLNEILERLQALRQRQIAVEETLSELMMGQSRLANRIPSRPSEDTSLSNALMTQSTLAQSILEVRDVAVQNRGAAKRALDITSALAQPILLQGRNDGD
ncbi:MAG: hypothetical protein FWE11_06290 [Defluviitaleaceae bacterium]|nr:hypothetical protein [Defluviitaleaceae bacterium]